MRVKNGRIKGARLLSEAVLETAFQGRARCCVRPHADAAAHVEENATQIVDAVRVVGVVVRVEHAIQGLDARIEQLFAKIRGRIDQHGRTAAFGKAIDQQRTAPPPVLRIGRIAGAPDRPNARNPAGRTGAKQREACGHVAMAARGVLV